jgi:hypothetical protein
LLDAETKFKTALDDLLEEVKQDSSVLAAVLCGSLSHDKVWDKSDIDLVLITIDDKKVDEGSRALYANGVNVHAAIMTRGAFRRVAEGAFRNSFMHSLLAKGRLLYSHDESITALMGQLQDIGERDTQLLLLEIASGALGVIYKAHKFLLTRSDLEYTSLWILYAANSLARIEVVSRRLLADREVIPQAMKLNPDFFRVVYTDLLNGKKTRVQVEKALAAIDDYIASRATTLFHPVLEYLREAGEVRSCTEIENYFTRNHGIENATAACEYLADQGLIGKAAVSIQLTRRSNHEVQELAFFHLSR